MSPRSKANGDGKDGGKQVFVLAEGRPRAVPVTVGASDGRFTEITGGELQAGTQVVTETAGAES